MGMVNLMLLHEIVKRGRRKDIALVEHDRRISYEEFAKAVERGQKRLYAQGIRQGDRVGIFSRNSIEFIYTYFSAASLGAISVPINFQLSHREIAYIVKDAGIKEIYTYKPLELEEYFSEDEVKQHDIKEINEEVEGEAPPLSEEFNWKEACTIIYTSGTTGNPKGAVLSHQNLVCNVQQIQIMKCRSEHKVLCVLPMYHCFSWTCSVLYPLYCGATVVVLENFTIKDMVELIKKETITDLYVVPSICTLLTKLAAFEDLASIRLFVCGGSTLPAKVANEFISKFKMPIYEAYGLSEASPIVTINSPGHVKSNSIGPLIPDVKARFVDTEGHDVPLGHEGELIIKGDNVMLGYWKLPEATKEAIDEEGWLHTGDIAKIDSDGYVYIVNRLKEMIISMGENIYPREVEEIIYQFPGIKDAAVVGVEDSRRGQVGICFFSTQDKNELDINKLRHFLQKNLALYKIPREFHQLDELPRTSTGKIFKRKILETFLK